MLFSPDFSLFAIIQQFLNDFLFIFFLLIFAHVGNFHPFSPDSLIFPVVISPICLFLPVLAHFSLFCQFLYIFWLFLPVHHLIVFFAIVAHLYTFHTFSQVDSNFCMFLHGFYIFFMFLQLPVHFCPFFHFNQLCPSFCLF